MDAYAFIWDMDGTLVDSYPAIIPALAEVCGQLGLDYSREELREMALRGSVGTLLGDFAARLGRDPAPIRAAFARLNDSRIGDIRPMPHAAETLETLRRAGHRHFVFTHRGVSAPLILERTGLAPYFTEVLSTLDGFARKPAPDGLLHLLRKYALDPMRCFYVGDRSLDAEAARAAGIGSILYLAPGSPVAPSGRETHVVTDLLQIPALPEL